MRDTNFDAFFYQGKTDKPAVLLLHGLGGNPKEMNELGRLINKEGYTVYCPVYSGHGYYNLRTFLNTKVSLWYDEALQAYDYLTSLGYQDIIVGGLSLGGAFTLKVAMDRNPMKIVPMSAPIFGFSMEHINNHAKNSVTNSKDIAPLDKERYITISKHQMIEIHEFYMDMKQDSNFDRISCDVFIIQGLLDNQRFITSAEELKERLKERVVKYKLYSNSGHVITMDKEKEVVFQDIIEFIKR